MLDLMGTFGEILIIVLLAIILLKPEDLPAVISFLKKCFNYMNNIKSLARDFFS